MEGRGKEVQLFKLPRQTGALRETHLLNTIHVGMINDKKGICMSERKKIGFRSAKQGELG